MKWVSYAWSVLLGLLKVAIAFGVLGKFSGEFERVAVSLLVLVYVMVEFAATSHAISFVQQFKQDRDRFVKLMRAVGSSEFEDEDYKEMMRHEDERIGRAEVKTYITWAFSAVIQLAALFTLWSALDA